MVIREYKVVIREKIRLQCKLDCLFFSFTIGGGILNINLKSTANGLDGNYRGSERHIANNYIFEGAMCDISMCVNSCVCDMCFPATVLKAVIYLCCICKTGLGGNTHMPRHTCSLNTWRPGSDTHSML